MFTRIKKLSLAFSSVDSIVKNITKMTTKLDQLEEHHKQKALQKTERIKSLEQQVHDQMLEVQRAVTIRSNLRKLLGE